MFFNASANMSGQPVPVWDADGNALWFAGVRPLTDVHLPANPATSPTSVTPAAARPDGVPTPGTPADIPSQLAGQPSLSAGFGSTSLSFEINEGQTDPQVRFLSRGAGFGFWLTDDAMVFGVSRRPDAQAQSTAPQGPHARPPSSPGRDVFRLRMVDVNPRAELVALDELQARSNYFVGADPTQWHTNVPQYARVEYRDIFPGVDLALHGHTPESRIFEYDFIVKPGASPEAVRLSWEGLQGLSVDEQGRMHLVTGGGEVIQDAPVTYQEVGGARQAVAARPVLRGDGEVGFEITGPYDRSRPLTIDPVFSFGSYLGGSGSERTYGVATDLYGSSYITGETCSTDFPIVNGYPSKRNVPETGRRRS